VEWVGVMRWRKITILGCLLPVLLVAGACIERRCAAIARERRFARDADTYGQLLYHIARGNRQQVFTLLGNTRSVPHVGNIHPLAQAARYGELEIVSAILARGIPPDIHSADGVTPLDHAAEAGQLGVADLLLASGARINARAADGSTALSAAAEHGRLQMIRFLLARGAEPHLRNNAGDTPLEVARKSRYRGADRAAQLLARTAAKP
jgi:ankyrin repeat protein